MMHDMMGGGMMWGRLKLAAMGVAIDQLTEQQRAYLSSWEEGT